jgi:hypothetical protein
VTDSSNEDRDRAGAKTMPQHEVDARLLREKTARLRELRLAREAANPAASAAAGKRTAVKAKKTPAASAKKPVPLSDWLTAQQKEGRRN